ncbi:MAG: hypothetical protein F6K58_13165 [Symploca sp. SIO2E9]|nr:hypothetical protein [Symploca sp. SIO2E9]
MKDSQALILKAFLAALYQQRSPLSDNIKEQLSKIAQSLESHILDLHDLAINTSTLATPYKNARLWFTSSASERGMGKKFLPADDTDDDDSQETPNITTDVSNEIEETARVMAAIDAKYEQASKVLSASDPVQAAKQEFN